MTVSRIIVDPDQCPDTVLYREVLFLKVWTPRSARAAKGATDEVPQSDGRRRCRRSRRGHRRAGAGRQCRGRERLWWCLSRRGGGRLPRGGGPGGGGGGAGGGPLRGPPL